MGIGCIVAASLVSGAEILVLCSFYSPQAKTAKARNTVVMCRKHRAKYQLPSIELIIVSAVEERSIFLALMGCLGRAFIKIAWLMGLGASESKWRPRFLQGEKL